MKLVIYMPYHKKRGDVFVCASSQTYCCFQNDKALLMPSKTSFGSVVGDGGCAGSCPGHRV